MIHPPTFSLSICIPTFNRARFLKQTLDSIISQASDDCEIVVSDNASTDDTGRVVADYALRFGRLRYIRQETNLGFDRNCDCAVEAAQGEYCWLFSDDDVMKPGAIATVLRAVRQGYNLLLVNGEHRDFTMTKLCIPNFLGLDSDRVYSHEEFERLFLDIGTCVICVCCVVIKRMLWIARERQRYYGSWFIHTAVVFQRPIPGGTLVIARPLMSLRLGNDQTAQAASFSIWYMSWPELLWSFPLSEATKRRFCDPSPWRRLRYLLPLRALGRYSFEDYSRWVRPRLQGALVHALIPALIARLPQNIAHGLYAIYSLICGRPRSPHEATNTLFPKCTWILRPGSSARVER